MAHHSISEEWAQFRHLDEVEYAKQIAKLSSEQLTAEHGRITRKLISAGMGTATGIVCAPASGGFSLVASSIQGRRTNVNSRRIKIIEARLAEIQAERYHKHKRDFLIPAAVNVATMGMTTGAENLLVGHVLHGTEGVVAGGQFFHEGTAQAAQAAAQHGTEGVLASSGQFINESILQAGGEAAQMAQEPLYTKIAEAANDDNEATYKASASSAHVVPSVPSPRYTNQSKPSVPSPGYAIPSAPSPRPTNHTIPSVPSPRLMPGAVPSVPSPGLPSKAMPAIPSPDFTISAPPPYTPTPIRPNINQKASLTPSWLPAEKEAAELSPMLPPRPTSALDHPSAEAVLALPPSWLPAEKEAAELSPMLPPRPTSALDHTSAGPALALPSSWLPAEKEAAELPPMLPPRPTSALDHPSAEPVLALPPPPELSKGNSIFPPSRPVSSIGFVPQATAF